MYPLLAADQACVRGLGTESEASIWCQARLNNGHHRRHLKPASPAPSSSPSCSSSSSTSSSPSSSRRRRNSPVRIQAIRLNPLLVAGAHLGILIWIAVARDFKLAAPIWVLFLVDTLSWPMPSASTVMPLRRPAAKFAACVWWVAVFAIVTTSGDLNFPYGGCIVVLAVSVVKLLQSLTQCHWSFGTRYLGERLRSAVTAEVYEKQLRLANAAKQRHGAGEIVSYIGVDAFRLGGFAWWMHYTWTAILQLALALSILVATIGTATLDSHAGALLQTLALVKSLIN